MKFNETIWSDKGLSDELIWSDKGLSEVKALCSGTETKQVGLPN
jgi:hypothetical protein